jgi:acylglycerol lipase
LKDSPSISLPLVEGDPSLAKEPEVEWLRASDGANLACRIWRGKVGQPVVLYLHGIEGHSQWFQNTASILNKRGITVYAPDRRGAGLNVRDRGHLTSYKVFLQDVEILLRQLNIQYAGHAIVLMGNCWGAKAASIMARSDYKPVDGPLNVQLSGLVLTCPAIYTKVDFDLKTKAKIAYSWLLGSHSQLRTWTIPIRSSMFTDNNAYLEYIEKDPLRLKEATASFFVETLRMGKIAQQSASHIEMPLLILQSGNDQIVDVNSLGNWYGETKSIQKSMRIFPDAAHSIDFDATWFKDYTHLLTEWLLARVPS